MMVDPTPVQAEQCGIAQHELLETINRLLSEGFPYPVVAAAMGAACAATVMKSRGAAGVPIWFAEMSLLSTTLAADG